jgi:hypothetical protein
MKDKYQKSLEAMDKVLEETTPEEFESNYLEVLKRSLTQE